jgi:hypothetical protein
MRKTLASGAAGLVVVVAAACGGHLAPLTDGGTEGPDSGGADVVVIDVIVVRPDSGPGPGCEPDNVPCINPQQCCSNSCINSVCGGPSPPPPCKPDGVACGQPGECCNFDCNMGVCGAPFADASPPPICPPGSNQCLSCVAASCCPQQMICQEDKTCVGFINCFDSCYSPGSGNKCGTMCLSQYNDQAVQGLVQCGTGPCAMQCQ